MPNKTSYSTINRSENNKIIGGVCRGLGEYFNLDPNIIRFIFVLLTIFGGSGLIIYLILWIIIPSKSQASTGNDHLKENLNDVKEKVREFAHDIRNSVKGQSPAKPHNRNFIAYAAILIGILFLLNNFGFGTYFNLDKLWPILLILLGVSIILRK